MVPENAVWLITGCSKGFGRSIAEEALSKGYRVVATARNPNELGDLVAKYGDSVLPLQLDVTKPDQIKAVIKAGTEKFERIDVLINNAGYGYVGAIEEGNEADVQVLFQTDLFSPIALIKQVLPGMRERGRGHIVNISSIGGLVSFPGLGYYNAVKAGVEAMSDALAQEVAPLGINVTVVAPGAFRTDFRGNSLKVARSTISDYADTAGKARSGIPAGHGKQRGDPVKGAQAIITAVESEAPPVHLLIGSDAIDQLRGKLDAMRAETDAWEELTRGTDLQRLSND